MKNNNRQRYQALVEEAQATAFSGWDFSWLTDRMVQADPPWDYARLVQAHCSQANSLLDLGTGGGEFLAARSPLPPEVHATESYPPNQPLAMARLTPLGVNVHCITADAPLPFDDQLFDLVINRHESYDPGEVYRILKPGGVFITQQVGELDNLELNQFLEAEQSLKLTDWGLETETMHLIEAGFKIHQAEKAALQTVFRDIGAVIYYLKAIPWAVEGFSIETHADQLTQLHDYIEQMGGLITTAHRFLIIASKAVSQP
jgi:SAM-dependent methyltransferase